MWVMSMPIQRRLSRSAAAMAVPQPHRQRSSTTSPSLLLALTMRSSRASGFWVG